MSYNGFFEQDFETVDKIQLCEPVDDERMLKLWEHAVPLQFPYFGDRNGYTLGLGVVPTPERDFPYADNTTPMAFVTYHIRYRRAGSLLERYGEKVEQIDQDPVWNVPDVLQAQKPKVYAYLTKAAREEYLWTGQTSILIPEAETRNGNEWKARFVRYCDWYERNRRKWLKIKIRLLMERFHVTREQALKTLGLS